MNKERFHNALAINLGSDRIVNNSQISIKIADTTPDFVVTLTSEVSHHSASFIASEDADVVCLKLLKAMGTVVEEQELKIIIDAIHQAYLEANTYIF